METVIAIGVLAVLLSGFVAVFAPAAQGIKRSISIQEAERLTTTLQEELGTLRTGQNPTSAATGFDKAFYWVESANDPATAILIYQYRGDISDVRSDGTPAPYTSNDGEPGDDYILFAVARRADDDLLADDLDALVGSIFYTKLTQLVFDSTGMILGDPGTIRDPEIGGDDVTDPDEYPEATIAFAADFYSIPTKTSSYLSSTTFQTRFNDEDLKPVFSRNLAIRR